MTAAVDLLTPLLADNDATSNHTRLFRRLLEAKGIRTRIVVEKRIGSDDVVILDNWTPDADVTILQHYIGSTTAQRVIQEQIQVVLNYHNITPAPFFAPWEPQTANDIRLGRQQLRELAPLTHRAITDSHYNVQELSDLGFEDIVVSPVLWRLEVNQQRDAELRSVPERGGTILFVGRIAPNKCHHDLLSALAMLTRTRSKARLVFVGDSASSAYMNSIKMLAKQLGVHDRVLFAGRVSAEELLRCYRQANVFVSASEHEGFGVPLAEAMANGLPVVAYCAAAVAETVGGAGLVLDDKRPLTLALAIDRVLGDEGLRRSLRNRGLRAAERFDVSVTGRQMWTALQDLLPGTG
jgi:glycosyltransferase involved in cell wall biosynthesis